MNITDLIVEQLKQGRSVELTGIGTLSTVMQSPRHDQAKGIYYPAHLTPTFTDTTSGDEGIVEVLAERECVGIEVARQMWHNYMDALSDKLHRSGSHTFGELGTLHMDASGAHFEVAEGLMLSVGDEKPIENVKTYAHDDDDDPFARFYAEGAAASESTPAPAAAEPEPEPKSESQDIFPESFYTKPEPQPEPEPEPEPEPIATEPEPIAAEEAATEADAAKPEATMEEDLKKLEEMPAAPAQEDEGHKSRWWLWLLLLLLLVVIGAGTYYLLSQRASKPETVAAAVEPATHLDGVPVENSLTYNTDLITYSQRDIDQNRDQVCRYMADYIDNYLAYRHYSGARVPMIDRVRHYVGERLGSLLADRFAVQRLMPHNDYIYNHNEPWLKQTFAARQRVTVQRELLDMSILDSMLDQLIAELGLEPDAGTPRTAEQVQQVKAEERKAIVDRQAKEEPAPVKVNVEQDSKQGFDIIAGFYLDRNSAARLTARLHELGSDAYIIEKNNMYYVSMGSAKNRTAAEALFKHIKSWYDGDVAIKQW